MREATEVGFFVQEQWVRDGESEARRAEAGHYNQKRSAAGIKLAGGRQAAARPSAGDETQRADR